MKVALNTTQLNMICELNIRNIIHKVAAYTPLGLGRAIRKPTSTCAINVTQYRLKPKGVLLKKTPRPPLHNTIYGSK